MHLCGYSVLSNDPNLEYFGIISFFGSFWSKLGHLTPGVSIHRAASNCYGNYVDDIASRFNLNVFWWLVCVINWPKLGGF